MKSCMFFSPKLHILFKYYAAFIVYYQFYPKLFYCKLFVSVHFNHWFKIHLSPLSLSHSLFSPRKISARSQSLFSLILCSCATKISRGKKEKQNKTFKTILTGLILNLQLLISNALSFLQSSIHMSTILQNDFTYSLPAYFQYISVLGVVKSYSNLPPEAGCVNCLTALCQKLILVYAAM